MTTAQVLATGATEDWLRWALVDGRLRRTRRGVYFVVGSPHSEYRALMEACLALGERAAASHFSAAWLWGARDIAPGALEVVVFGACSGRLPGVQVRRSTLDPGGLVTVRYAVPVVTPQLAILQLAGLDYVALAERVANDLVARNITTFSAILSCSRMIGTRGRKGVAEMARVCERELEVAGHDDSPAARKLGRALRRAGLPPFETQHEVVVDGKVMHFDFAWPDQKVGLEYQGRRDHTSVGAIDRDAARRDRLTGAGWRVLDATAGLSNRDVIAWARATLSR